MNYAVMMAETLLNRYPNPSDFPYQLWCYSQGFMLLGFVRLYMRTGEERWRDYVLHYCRSHVDEAGHVAGFSGCSLDDMMAGVILVWAYRSTGDMRYQRACEMIYRSFSNYPRNPDGGFWHARDLPGEMWVDGLFMGCMFLIYYGQYAADAQTRGVCYTEVVRQLRIGHMRCVKPGTALLCHAYSANVESAWADPLNGRSSEVWSEGLGWYAMVLCEALKTLPNSFEGYAALRADLTSLMRDLAILQDARSGMWCQIVDKPSAQGNWFDSSGSAMLALAMLRAAQAKLIDASYIQLARRAYRGICENCISCTDGQIDIRCACDGLCVQADYAHYIHYPQIINAKEATAAFFLLAVETEYPK